VIRYEAFLLHSRSTIEEQERIGMKKTRIHSQVTVGNKISDVLITYAKTQLLVMSVITVVTWVILSRVGVQFALLLALITGAVSVVPVVGMMTAAIIASAVAIFDSVRFLPDVSVLFEGIAVLIIYGLLNILTDYFLSPYLIGKSAGIHPVMLLVFVLIGTFIFGVWVALLTVPAILVLKTISELYHLSGK